ncbi:hypothetical protein AAVH_22719 [Aphelenchoides avenae]|nr:hypothetical protein AAVH_22719 [Aphelenchus avenae]
MRENVDDLQCHIGALHIENSVYDRESCMAVNDNGEAEGIDYALADFLGEHLKPTLEKDAAPDCVIPELFGVDVVESCGIATEVDPRPWIRKFVEMFETAGPETGIVRSVTLLYNRFGEDTSSLLDLKPLGQPCSTDIPKPHSEIEERLQERRRNRWIIAESPVAELFLFENAKLAQKLELLVWTIEQPHGYHGTTGFPLDYMHYAFLLRVVDL